MIVGSSYRIFPVDAFFAGLTRVRRGVVLVRSAEGGLSTGFLITPTLVMMPGFAASPESGYGRPPVRVERHEQGALAWQVPVVRGLAPLYGHGLLGEVGGPHPAVALLQLVHPVPDEPLELSFGEISVGQPVTLLHFADGSQTLVLSTGTILSAEGPLIAYDADTVAGSSGAPIFDDQWRVIGMHEFADHERKANVGLKRAALLDAICGSTHWAEIAAQHRLADVSAATQQLALARQAKPSAPMLKGPVVSTPAVSPKESSGTPQAPRADSVLLQAAVSASFDPAQLADEDKGRLRPLVIDAAAARWVLRPAERERAISGVGSLSALRPHLRRSADPDPAQQVIDRILSGPPYDLDEVSEEALPWWIQAVRWFRGIEPSLPTAADVTRVLERRRSRSRLARLAGTTFRGRQRELKQLSQWFAPNKGPLSLIGIGGIGKSALVARFASQRPADTLILWLDFDRPDLAPDDGVSVLAAIAEQAAVQIDGFEAPTIANTRDSNAAAHDLGKRLAASLSGASTTPPPLLVLDSFEAAQYAERYQELWPVLEALATELPALRVIVTGRAPVPGLALRKREAVTIRLKGLETDDARTWLQEKGVADPAVLDRVIDLADGIPLVLRLAVLLVEAGGHVEDLPQTLPPEIVSGFLYDRILDRVQNPALKPVAMAALILRRFTIEMIEPVIDHLVDLPPGEPSAWFNDLAREMALVEGTDVLRLRPEVRAATLQLLTRDRPDLVEAIDRRAADWYANTQDVKKPELAAELVYHRLRLGDVAGAKAAWQDGCGAFLLEAADELTDTAARKWLRQRLVAVPAAEQSLEAWEQLAAERIRDARARRLDRAVSGILRERKDRTANSVLIFHDAYALRQKGRNDKAAALLDTAGWADRSDSIGRDRRVLRALIAREMDDRNLAERALRGLELDSAWSDRPFSPLNALVILAARVRLTIDLDAELKVLRSTSDRRVSTALKKVLSPVDVILPRLRRKLRPRARALEGSAVPVLGGAHSRLADLIERERLQTATRDVSALTGRAPARAAAARVLEFARNRWSLVSSTSFLPDAYERAATGLPTSEARMASVFGTFAIFAGSAGTVQLGGAAGTIDQVLQRCRPMESSVDQARWQEMVTLLKEGVDEHIRWHQGIQRLKHLDLVFIPDETIWDGWGDLDAPSRCLLLYLISPDPLTELAYNLAASAPL